MSSDDLLSFKEFPPVHVNQNRQPVLPKINTSTIKDTTKNEEDTFGNLINEMSTSVQILDQERRDQDFSVENPTQQSNMYSFWSIEYYQQFFNVDTKTVWDRITVAFVPKKASPGYLKSQIELNPDLYGPFWITVTLIFSIAISGNIASYLQHANENYHWRYNFHLVSYAATAIFIYAFFIPIGIWAAFKWSLKPAIDDYQNELSTYNPSLLSLICVYGYSLAIYIPVSILWVIQITILQWILVIAAAFLSGSALILILTSALRNSSFSLILIIVILLAHFLLAAGFLLFFFNAPSTSLTATKIITDIVKNNSIS